MTATIALASGRKTGELQQTNPGSSASNYFRILYAQWNYAVASTLCNAGEQADHYVQMEGPLKLGEGSYNSSIRAYVRMRVARTDLGGGVGITNTVWYDCRFCPAGKHSEYVAPYPNYDAHCDPTCKDPPQHTTIIHDPTNNRVGLYYSARGGWFVHLSETEIGTDKFDTVRIGAAVDGDSELGPWWHDYIHYKHSGSSSWFRFSPDDAASRHSGWDKQSNGVETYFGDHGDVAASVYVGESGWPGCP
jgi:hypothetical protein